MPDSGSDQGLRRGQRVAAADKTDPIGFALRRLDIPAFAGQRMDQPARWLAGGARPPFRQQRSRFRHRHPFGLDEQFGKGRVRGVGSRRIQHHFSVTGQF